MVLLSLDLGMIIEKLILVIVIISASLLIAMYSTYAERKIAAVIQDRIGPKQGRSIWFASAIGRWIKIIYEGRDHS